MTTQASQLIETRLSAIRFAARGTHLFTFARPDGGLLPPAEAGAHIGILLPNGMERQYSLVHPDDAPHEYTVGVKLDDNSRGGSRYLHDTARVGAIFPIRPPANNFALDESAGETLLIAGGIGITPIHAMMERLEALGRPWRLVHASRSREDAAFLRELQHLPNVAYHFDDEAGRPLDMTAIVAQASPQTHLYCCGPAPMLAAFEAATTAAGASDRAHVEYFTSKFAAASEGGFVVELARTGTEISIEPGESILHALRDIGIDIPYSCEEGVCGSCETRVLAGTPDHRDAILSEAEREKSETMMVCCSGCKGDRLVLDL